MPSKALNRIHPGIRNQHLEVQPDNMLSLTLRAGSSGPRSQPACYRATGNRSETMVTPAFITMELQHSCGEPSTFAHVRQCMGHGFRQTCGQKRLVNLNFASEPDLARTWCLCGALVSRDLSTIVHRLIVTSSIGLFHQQQFQSINRFPQIGIHNPLKANVRIVLPDNPKF